MPDPLVVQLANEFRRQLQARDAVQMAEMARRWLQVERRLRGEINGLAQEVYARWWEGGAHGDRRTLLGYKPKVLVPVRDIRDVLASFERLWRKTAALGQTADEAANYQAYQLLENRLDMWAGHTGPVGMAYNRIRDALARGWAAQMHFVRYEALTARPAETMAEIYGFLGEEQFPHEPGHVAQVTTEDDRVYGFVGLHTIRAQVRPQAPAWPAVLGQHAERFAGQEVW